MMKLLCFLNEFHLFTSLLFTSLPLWFLWRICICFLPKARKSEKIKALLGSRFIWVQPCSLCICDTASHCTSTPQTLYENGETMLRIHSSLLLNTEKQRPSSFLNAQVMLLERLICVRISGNLSSVYGILLQIKLLWFILCPFPHLKIPGILRACSVVHACFCFSVLKSKC